MARLAGGKQIDEIRGAVITYDSNNEYYTASSSGDKGAGDLGTRARRALAAPAGQRAGSAAAGAEARTRAVQVLNPAERNASSAPGAPNALPS